ncbi:MAG TPA: GGDEF domain-containing phosphodiesterase, partial [Chloroflexota bacterium]
DLIGRVGDDEFALILPNTSMSAAMGCIRKVQSALRAPFVVLGARLNVRARVGAALSPQHATEPGVLYTRADTALHLAKGRDGQYAFYDPARDPYSADRIALVDDLRRAIREDQLVLHYQPKVDVQTCASEKVEALVRWNHPERGLLLPECFVPLAEDTGLIEPLTLWVLRSALRQCQSWAEGGLQISVAVNLSAHSLGDQSLVDVIAGLLRRAALGSGALEVEITEGTLMANASDAMHFLSGLHDLGVRVSIDDFGTGYSSFAYLKLLPIDHIKIDRGFVMKMATNDNDAIIVRSIIDLGHNLGLEVIAEGVESSQTWMMLRDRHCDLAQGYYMSRPLRPDDAAAWLRTPEFATQ